VQSGGAQGGYGGASPREDRDAAEHEQGSLHHLRRDRVGRDSGPQPHVPRSPKQIADSAIAAAKAGAAVVHCHVRDPETGKPSRKLEYYREVTERIRDSDTDVVLNLTAGMGGDMYFDGTEEMTRMAAISTCAGPRSGWRISSNAGPRSARWTAAR
jgi:hypothetical protein